jgi:glycosyltransferase involved in cell wall biosynthesis
VSSHAAPIDPRQLARRIALPRVGAAALGTVGFGALIAAIALEGTGGLQLGPLTTVEIALEILAGVAGCAAILVGAPRRMHGGPALALFAVLLAFTAASIIWAVDPDDAWVEANRTLAWLAAFALGIALVRLWPDRWDSLLGGVVLGALIVCGYAILTKVFPGTFNPDEIYARLREPFGYWNSVGLLSAMAVPACLWLGARRAGVPFVLWSALWAELRTPAHVLARPLMAAIYRDAAAVVAYGPHVAAFARRHGATRVELAPQAVDNAFWSARAPEPERPAPFTVVFVGRPAREKGVAELLAAWRAAALDPAKAALVLAGQGHEGAAGTRGVRVVGALSPRKLRNFYAGADVVAIPSVRSPRFVEPWGLVANEAMNQHCAVIATDAVGAAAGGLVAHNRTGIVVPAADPTALGAAIRRLHDDPARRKRLAAAGAEAVKAYTYDTWAAGFAAALQGTTHRNGC